MIVRVPTRAPATLAGWASALEGRLVAAPGDRAVHALADDSRAVGAGDLFFARRGAAADGVAFARDAVARGAVAVVHDAALPEDLPGIRVASAPAALLAAADLFYGRPQDDLALVGITGTKGKTTVAWLVTSALRFARRGTALLGTIRHEVAPSEHRPALNTTPGVLEIRRLLAEARERGAQAAALEVSSHALDQGRVEGLRFSAAVFTNLGHDHLDYHRDLATYFAAKASLFEGLEPTATAILNLEDERSAALAALTKARVTTYGEAGHADLTVTALRLGIDGTRFTLVVDGDQEIAVSTPLIGRHNALNLAAAVGAARALGLDALTAVRGAESLAAVPGRLQAVAPPGDGTAPTDVHAFVDYAHTEEALRAVLSFLRAAGAVPLVCVVGCGGDRDRAKRPRMARAAASLADRVILTSDNPRSEDPRAILAEMEAGLGPEHVGRTSVVVDRREAIALAVATAPPGATVLVAGKGHETYQILGTRTVPFDDVEEVRAALVLRRRQGGASRAPSRS